MLEWEIDCSLSGKDKDIIISQPAMPLLDKLMSFKILTTEILKVFGLISTIVIAFLLRELSDLSSMVLKVNHKESNLMLLTLLPNN